MRLTIGVIWIAGRDEARPRAGHVYPQEPIVDRCRRAEVGRHEVVLDPEIRTESSEHESECDV
jgi:hypothetical protein